MYDVIFDVKVNHTKDIVLNK